jgi:outer membrane lipoprotein carrier protein
MRLTFSLAAILLTVGAFAQTTTELDRAAAAMAGKEASFTHRFTPKGFKNSQVEQGTVLFGKLPAMRWSYTSPEEKLFVFDGSRSWFYVPGDKQVTLGRVTDARKRELPFLMLGDAAARERAFVVREQKRGGSVVTTLQPRDGTALVKTVTLTIDPASHFIQKIEYTDREGNRTAFDFSGYHPRAASAGAFRFDPPAGVQVVNAD